MHFLLLPVAAVLGALGRRVAGGLFQDLTHINTGDMPVRAFYGLMLGAVAYLGGFELWSLAIAAAVFVGSCLGSPEVAHGLPSKLGYVLSALTGLWNYASVIGVAYFAHHYAGMGVIAAGSLSAALLVALFYGHNTNGPVGFRGWTELWECAWGALMGVSVFLAGSL